MYRKKEAGNLLPPVQSRDRAVTEEKEKFRNTGNTQNGIVNFNEPQMPELQDQVRSVIEQSLLLYQGYKVAFEKINGKWMINATQMAAPFGKRTVAWLDTEQAQDILKTISKVRKMTLADLQFIKRGGNNPGTWFQEDVALCFAQWLNPEFYLLCNDKLKELLTKGNRNCYEQFGFNLPEIDVRVDIYGEQLRGFPYVALLESLGMSTKKRRRRWKKSPTEFWLNSKGTEIISLLGAEGLLLYAAGRKNRELIKENLLLMEKTVDSFPEISRVKDYETRVKAAKEIVFEFKNNLNRGGSLL